MGQKTILLVDDSKTLLMIEGMMLSKAPYRVVTAVDGMEAIEKAHAERPDLILLDVAMPKLDGLEVCRRLKADPATRHVPVIMVTTRGEAGNRDRAFECGCDDYLTKPIDAATLMEAVKTHLAGDQERG
jgi:CheY-like chemotaxis protein